jgi:hypothetical protein
MRNLFSNSLIEKSSSQKEKTINHRLFGDGSALELSNQSTKLSQASCRKALAAPFFQFKLRISTSRFLIIHEIFIPP